MLADPRFSADCLAEPDDAPGNELLESLACASGSYPRTTHDLHVFSPEPSDDGHAALFSKLELLVIGIGDRDPPTLLRPDGLLARLRRLLFGIEAPAPFADPRLEALRSLTGALHRRSRNLDAAVIAALAEGITREQIAHLEARMTR